VNLDYTPEELAFRAEVRRFLEDNLPLDLRAKVTSNKRLTREDYVRWHTALAKRGWVAPLWPREHGGAGWDVVRRHLFDEECALAGAPPIIPFGVAMVGPVILKFGTEHQKEHYLPRILDGTHWWCQGYSEPGSGSDLASLNTRAVRDADHYVVNGQKTWTTLAQFANMIFCLVRTDPVAKQQQGISFLLIDMASPGITVRPIITLDGEHEVNEVFFDDVQVPVANLVGQENDGWTCAKYLLTYERTGHAAVGTAKQALHHLKSVALRQIEQGRPLIEDPAFRRQLAEVEIELLALEITNLRVIASVHAGGAPGVESSLLKICGSEIRQSISDLLRRAVGPYALPFWPETLHDDRAAEWPVPLHATHLASQYFNRRKLSIYAGSNEIQKNIIAKSMLAR
jgi:alkylation response protein AidB-like acyl-CoA dehydrogenase